MARISDADKDAIRNAYALGRANMVVLAQEWGCSRWSILRIIQSGDESHKASRGGVRRFTDEEEEKIKQSRALHNVSYRKLAKEWGCSTRAIFYALNNRGMPDENHDIQQTCGVPGEAEYPAETGHTEQFNPFIGWWYPHRGYRDRVYMTKPQRRYAKD